MSASVTSSIIGALFTNPELDIHMRMSCEGEMVRIDASEQFYLGKGEFSTCPDVPCVAEVPTILCNLLSVRILRVYDSGE